MLQISGRILSDSCKLPTEDITLAQNVGFALKFPDSAGFKP